MSCWRCLATRLATAHQAGSSRTAKPKNDANMNMRYADAACNGKETNGESKTSKIQQHQAQPQNCAEASFGGSPRPPRRGRIPRAPPSIDPIGSKLEGLPDRYTRACPEFPDTLWHGPSVMRGGNIENRNDPIGNASNSNSTGPAYGAFTV